MRKTNPEISVSIIAYELLPVRSPMRYGLDLVHGHAHAFFCSANVITDTTPFTVRAYRREDAVHFSTLKLYLE